jgi:hypothetical protein
MIVLDANILVRAALGKLGTDGMFPLSVGMSAATQTFLCGLENVLSVPDFQRKQLG